MPTPTEQKALAFLGIVILLGGAVRVVRAGAPPEPLPQERQALARQASAAESAASAAKAPKARRAPRIRAAKPGIQPIVVGGVTTVPPYAGYRDGFSAPLPRIDVDNRLAAPPSTRPGGSTRQTPPTTQTPLDLDLASAAELERLPNIGPALARRIVAHRDSVGAFGSLEALQRVRGIGPATASRLVPLVTFSGRPSSRP